MKRMHHSSAYDHKRNVVYTTFGISNGDYPLKDMILYYPNNDSIVRRWSWSKGPNARFFLIIKCRYSHFSWMVDNTLILFGGKSWDPFLYKYFDLNDVWSYDPGILFSKLKNRQKPVDSPELKRKPPSSGRKSGSFACEDSSFNQNICFWREKWLWYF